VTTWQLVLMLALVVLLDFGIAAGVWVIAR
jgi:hypothetical protein